ncbi:hypothetical protein NC652_026680 [Populus alba x Populus x berolinensis]|nr:hypothetical protein NC652_026680 [Populus alba x Populus x berolinensis]
MLQCRTCGKTGFGCVHLVNEEDARREPSTISWTWL